DGQPAADAIDQVYAAGTALPPAGLGLRRAVRRLHDHMAMDHRNHRHGDLSDVDPARHRDAGASRAARSAQLNAHSLVADRISSILMPWLCSMAASISF